MEPKEYELKTEISYQSKGQNEHSKRIVFKAPSYNNRKDCWKIKQQFVTAITGLDTGSKEPQQKESSPKPSDYFNIFLMSEKVDIEKVMESFENLICNGCAYIDDIEPLRKTHYEKFSLDDQENMMGEYLNHFLLSSMTNQN